MLEVSYSWYNDDKRILLISITPDEWSWDDAVIIVREKVKLMEKVPHEVHTIYLLSSPPRIPKDNLFHNIKLLMATRAPNEGLTFFIGVNRLFKSFLTTAAKIGRLYWAMGNYHYVMTIEQALEKIEEYETQQLNSED